MVRQPVVICRSDELPERAGKRFEIERNGEVSSAFAVRFDGKCHAYLNRCPHARTELDWLPGEFFDSEGLYLVCATHGAQFAPDSGRCVLGPCRGDRLSRIEVREDGGVILMMQD